MYTGVFLAVVAAPGFTPSEMFLRASPLTRPIGVFDRDASERDHSCQPPVLDHR